MTKETGTNEMGAAPADERLGHVVVATNVAGTALFALTAISAAVFFTTALQWIGAITAMVLFAVGVVTFLWSYYNAVQRSRHEEISVLQLYLLTGSTAPGWVRWRMWGAMAAQVIIAVATALSRPDGPDGRPGSSLAVGILVPMMGFGLNGLWAAFHGRFEPRREPRPKRTAVTGADDASDADITDVDERDDDGECGDEREDDADDPVMAANDDSVDKNAEHG